MQRVAERGLAASPISEILIERSVVGWKEYELEVMRDHADNVVVICSIENVDAMGVHTGESITVAPAQTLTDVEYQRMRDAAFACIRRIGVETGGSNVQFAVDPATGEQVIIEMNPRVSRSSALASKATGFPIAKIAAKLAVGYRLDEVRNDITRETPASFEPTIDYVVTKIPRWAFEKLPGSSPVLGTQMQSVGEVMAIGRTFVESLQKALRSLETGRLGLNCDPGRARARRATATTSSCSRPRSHAGAHLPDRGALRRFVSVERVHEATGVDPWFCDQILQIVEERDRLAEVGFAAMTRADWRRAKQHGFSDAQLAFLWERRRRRGARGPPRAGRARHLQDGRHLRGRVRRAHAVPLRHLRRRGRGRAADRPAVLILGSGPNRIGQGVEFDYCCVHAAFALRDAGFETVMVNCNPETVSTDYDTSDRLFFEPLTEEDVLNVCHALQDAAVRRRRARGCDRRPRRADAAEARAHPGRRRHPILGYEPGLDRRGRGPRAVQRAVRRLGIPQPDGGIASSVDEAVAVAARVGYPVLVRPSYVLGGRDGDRLRRHRPAPRDGRARAHRLARTRGRPVGRAARADRPLPRRRGRGRRRRVARPHRRVVIGAVMEHIEQAGVHSGDSACAIPPPTLSGAVLQEIDQHTRALADALEVVGLLNVQYAVKDGKVFVIEANPRASRTVPFVSKATGVPLAKVAARAMVGATFAELRAEGLLHPPAEGGHVSVKEAVLPFNRFPDVDTVLGPEMRSTGEVMGIDRTFGMAFAKSQAGAGNTLPSQGTGVPVAGRPRQGARARRRRRFAELGFAIAATAGTADMLERAGIAVDTVVAKVGEQVGVDAVDLISSGKVDLVVNTPRGRGPRTDGMHIRRAAIVHGVACVTTVAAALPPPPASPRSPAASPEVRSLQEYHRDGQLRLEL